MTKGCLTGRLSSQVGACQSMLELVSGRAARGIRSRKQNKVRNAEETPGAHGRKRAFVCLAVVPVFSKCAKRHFLCDFHGPRSDAKRQLERRLLVKG